jgi:Condensation domain/Phytanoyl-CoA dioxygenase (PhyH)
VIQSSLTQQRLWFLNQLEDASGTWNVPVALRLRGTVDRAALGSALVDTVLRQSTLRTVFVDRGGVPWQRVLEPEAVEVPLRIAVAGADLAEKLAAEAVRGFDLACELPVRVWLFEVGPQDQVLLFVMHHIAMDGWSLEPLFRDLAVAYEARLHGREPVWTPLPVQYTDYAEWQRELLGEVSDPESLISRQLHYWRANLAGVPEELALPYDRPRPAVGSRHGAFVPLVLDVQLHQALTRLAQRTGTSLFMVFHAALAALLTGIGAGHDIPIATPTAGRSDEALDDLVGFFINTLVLRIDTSGDPTFEELLIRVRKVALEALSHQDVPFDRLVEELNPKRTLARQALFQIMLMIDEQGGTLRLPGVECSTEHVDFPIVRFDMWLGLTESRSAEGDCQGVSGELIYSTDLFDRSTMENLAEKFVSLLRTAAARPELPLASLNSPRAFTAVRRRPIKLQTTAQLTASRREAAIDAMKLPGTNRSRYEQEGWLRSPQVLDDDLISRVTARIEALSAQDRPDIVYEKDTRIIRAIHGCHLFDDLCRQLVRLPALLGLAEELLGEPVYVYQFKVNMKQANEGAAWPWHQDFAFWHREDGMVADRAVNIAVHLDEVHDQNGPLCVIPRSHRLGLLDKAPSGAGGDWHKHVSADLEYTVPDELAGSLAHELGTAHAMGPKGAIYAFHPTIVHSSSRNRSADRRALLLVTYNAVSNAPQQLTRPEFLVSRDTTPLTPLAMTTAREYAGTTPGSPVGQDRSGSR